MNLQSVWSTLTEADEPLDEYPMIAMMNVVAELNLPPDWFTWVAAGFLFGEEAITTEKYMRLFPYGLTQANKGRFASAVQQGYLTVNDIGEYRLSDSGLEVLKKIGRAVDASADHLDPMPKEGVQKLADYLTRLASVSFIMPEPPVKWLISYKRRNMRPVEGSCLLRYVINYYDQIAAYRDDMYVATWQAHGVEGHTWETLDKFYGGEALAFDELYEKLKARGAPQDVYAHDLQELVKRGWIKEESDKYQITPAGKKTREDVEAETERLFFAPWSCMSEAELEDLSNLATQLRDGLKNLEVK